VSYSDTGAMSQPAELADAAANAPGPSHGFADELFGFDVPPKMREFARFPLRVAGPDTPPINPNFLFRKDHVKIGQAWISGLFDNLMLSGPTGAGKTSFIEQFAARLGWGVIRVACSKSLELQEIVGRVSINSDGSTGWVDGPAIRAMKEGAILLLDEINFLDPGQVGGMNTILDGGSFLIPETGERVLPHSDFRVAATGNALDGENASSYRGIQRMNDALLDRFRGGIEVGYLSKEEETRILVADAPRLHPSVVKLMVELAETLRKSYESGDLSVVLSTRIVVAWGTLLQSFSTVLDGQRENLLATLRSSFLFRVGRADRAAIEAVLVGVLKRSS
jgi:cobaltochelatase CobS